jgi:hypothetical protein
MDFNKVIRLPVRIALLAAAVIALFFAVRINPDIAALLGWEISARLFMGIFCGVLFAFFLLIFFLRGVGFRAALALLIAYVCVIFAFMFFDGVKGIEQYIAAGEFTSGVLKTEIVTGFDETALLRLCARMREMAAALVAFTGISFAALFVPRPKTAAEEEKDAKILKETGKDLWLSSAYIFICTVLYVFGGNIMFTPESAPLLFKALAVFQKAIGFGAISLKGLGQIMFALPFIVNYFMKGGFKSLAGALSFAPTYEVITTHADGSKTSDGGTQSAMAGSFLRILFFALKYGFMIVFFTVFGIPLTFIKMLAGIFRYDIRYDRVAAKPFFLKTPYLIFFVCVITFLGGMIYDRVPQLFEMVRKTVTL